MFPWNIINEIDLHCLETYSFCLAHFNCGIENPMSLGFYRWVLKKSRNFKTELILAGQCLEIYSGVTFFFPETLEQLLFKILPNSSFLSLFPVLLAKTSVDKQEGLSRFAKVGTCLSKRSCSPEGPWKENCPPLMWWRSVFPIHGQVHWPVTRGELVLSHFIWVVKLVNF